MTAINHLIDSVLQVITGIIPVIKKDQNIIPDSHIGWSSCLIRQMRDDPGWSQYICSIWSEDRSRVIHRRRTRLCHPFCRQISRFHRYLTARQCANSLLTTHVQPVITGLIRQVTTVEVMPELCVFLGKLANVISYKSYNCSEAVASTPDDLRLAPQPFQKLHLLGLTSVRISLSWHQGRIDWFYSP